MNNFVVVNVAQWYSRWLEEWRLKVQIGGNFDRIIIVLNGRGFDPNQIRTLFLALPGFEPRTLEILICS